MWIFYRFFFTVTTLGILSSYSCQNSNNRYINQGISIMPYTIHLDTGTKAEYIYFENPHLNTITCFKNGIKFNEVGDLYHFNSRLISSRNFIIPLDSTNITKQAYTFIVSKTGENLSFKWELLNKDDLNKKLKKESIFLGIILGTFGIIISLGLVLLLVTGEKNEIYFLIYIILSMIWLLNDLGLLYQYIWPSLPKFHQLSRTIFSTLSLSSYVLMIFKSYHPKIKLPFKVFMVGFGLFILIRIIFIFIRNQFSLDENIKTIGLYTNAIVILSLFQYLLYLLIKNVFTEKTNLFEKSGIYLYWTIVVSEALHQFGFDLFGPLQYYPEFIFVFFIAQIITTAISLILNYYQRKIAIENEKQAIMISLERNMNQSLLTGQELERERIGRNIHDEIGSLLASMKLNISTMKNKYRTLTIKKNLDELLYLVNQTIENKYQIIYDLAPIDYHSESLREAVLKRINLYKDALKIEFQVKIDDHINLSEKNISTLYRIILELLNNGIKHSAASKIKLRVEHDLLSRVILHYEDNGTGFDVDKTISKGGLKTTLMNIKSINAKYKLKSGIQGTSFEIFIDTQAS
jgi:signal transduction histidine kinase